MQRFLINNLLRPVAALALVALAALTPTLHAAELGDVAARSYIGQPLSADVELLTGDGGPVQARLARPDIYRGANITMNPALASVRMTQARRNGKDVLHITTAGAINAEYVHVYVELNAGGRRDIRLATVWLQPDPMPASPVRVAPVVVAPAAIAAAELARVADSAASAGPLRDRTRPAPMPSFHESELGGPGSLKAAAVQVQPPALVPVRDIPERISEALGARVMAPATVAGKPAPAVAGKPASDKTRLAEKPVANAGATPASAMAEKLGANGVIKSADKLGASGASKPADKPAEKTAGKPAEKTAEKTAGKSVEKLPEKLVAKADNKPVTKPEATAARSEAVAAKPAIASTKPAVAKPSVANAPPAGCAAGSSAKDCPVPNLQGQALSTKLVELEGKMKQLQSAITTSTGTAAAAQVATPVATRAAPAAAAESARVAKPLTIAPGMGEARAAAPDAKPVAASQAAPAPAPVPKAEAAADAAAPVAEAASAQQRRVLPKLKYKKEKPPEEPSSKLPWILGAVGAALLAGAGVLFYLYRKRAGKPLKFWQGLREKPRKIAELSDELRDLPVPDWASPVPVTQP